MLKHRWSWLLSTALSTGVDGFAGSVTVTAVVG